MANQSLNIRFEYYWILSILSNREIWITRSFRSCKKNIL